MESSNAREELIVIGVYEFFSESILYEKFCTRFHTTSTGGTSASPTSKWRIYPLFFTLFSNRNFGISGKCMPIPRGIL
jgi:hypothetical protein